jgi:hypothetical protein
MYLHERGQKIRSRDERRSRAPPSPQLLTNFLQVDTNAIAHTVDNLMPEVLCISGDPTSCLRPAYQRLKCLGQSRAGDAISGDTDRAHFSPPQPLDLLIINLPRLHDQTNPDHLRQHPPWAYSTLYFSAV